MQPADAVGTATIRDRIPIAGPWITEKEVSYVADAARTAWYSDANRYHERFEQAFAKAVGRRHAISLPSCTSALHLALAALGVGPGDEVVVPDITWIATAAPVSYLGATPVFAEVDRLTWCLDPATLAQAISPKTKALIVVDLYGNMPMLDEITGIAATQGVAVIEDAAEAIGSTYKGRPAGSFGIASAFSFHGSKTLTTGEGGILVTDDDRLRERCLVLRDHGRQPGDQMFRNTEIAFKYKMSSLQAALGLAQLERLEELVGRKRQIFRWYQEQLADFPAVTLNPEPQGGRNSYWMVTALWDRTLSVPKEAVIDSLRARGVETRPFFYPLSSLAAYADVASARAAASANSVAYDLSQRGLNLPSALALTEDQVRYAAQCFRDVLLGCR